MIKKIDSLAVLDFFYLKKINICKWCADNNFNRRTFYRVINNEIGIKTPGRATRHIRAALERNGLMVYVDTENFLC